MKRAILIIVILGVSIFLLIAGYFVFVVGRSVKEKFALVERLRSLDTLNTAPLEKTSESIDSLTIPQFLTLSQSLFVGSEKEGDAQLVYGIDIRTIDSTSFSYTLDFLKNWNKFRTVKGTAIHDDANRNYLMEDENGISIPAYKFVDRTNHLIIMVSRVQYLTSAIARVKKTENGKLEEFTGVMYYK